MSYRLIQKNQGLLPAEQSVLKLLSLPSMETMIYDMKQAPIYTSRFQKHILKRIDEDCCTITEDILTLVAKNNGFNVKVITAGAWPCTVSSIPYGTMTIPKQLQLIQSEFECFYRAHHSKDGSRLTNNTSSDGLDLVSLTGNERNGSRRLHWCYGLGSITLNCFLHGKIAVSVEVNEPQAALLLLFNRSLRSSLFVKEICRELNLSLEVVSCILKSLCEHSHKLLAVITTTPKSDINSNSVTQMNDRVVVDDSFLCPATSQDLEPIDMASGYFSQHCQHSVHVVKDFRREVIDATIVRLLKSAIREKTDFVYVANENGIMTRKAGFHSDILVERVIKRLSEQNTQFFVPSSEVLARCDYLSDINYISKVSCNIDEDPQVLGVGYCYHLEVDSSKEDVDSSLPSSSALQSNKLEQGQLPLTGDKLFDRMCSVLNIQEDKTKAEENSFYESKDSAYITSNHFLKSFVEWISNSPTRVQSQEESLSPYSNSDDQTEFHFGAYNTADGAPPLPMMANKTYAQFHSLLHRLYNSYAIMVDQLNKLLHQHSLGVQDVSIPGNGTIYLPPISLSRYMACIEDKFFSEFTEKLHFDHLDIHENVFCSLPRDVLKVVMQSFIRILKQSAVQRKIGDNAAAHHKDGVEDNAKRLGLEEAASLVDKAERDGFEKPQLSELWSVEFEVDVSTLQEEDVGPLNSRFFKFLSLYAHEVARSQSFRSNLSVDSAALGIIRFSLRIFVLACCHCLPVDKEISASTISGGNLFAGLSNSNNPKNTSAAHRGKYSSKVEKRKNKTPSKRGNDGSNTTPSTSSFSQSVPVPRFNSAGFQPGPTMAISGWQSAFAFNPPSNLESGCSIDSKCDNGSAATIGSIIDAYSIPLFKKQSSALSKEQVSGDSSLRFLPPLPIDISQNQHFLDIDDLRYNNPFLSSTTMRSRSNSDVMGTFFKSISSDTRAEFMGPECSLSQLLQVYNSGFIQHMRTLFQVPESAATTSEKVLDLSSAYISESLFSWFDKISLTLHEEYPDIHKELFWLHQSPRFDLNTMFGQAYTILDSNQDKQLTEDDFCGAEGDSGVVNPVENLMQVGLRTSGSSGLKNIQGDCDDWKPSNSNLGYLSALQLNDIYADRSKVGR